MFRASLSRTLMPHSMLHNCGKLSVLGNSKNFSTLLSHKKNEPSNPKIKFIHPVLLSLPQGGANYRLLSTEVLLTETLAAPNAIAEPTFQSIGLASSHLPPGWLQALMEQIHLNFDLPWWATIAATTFAIRLTFFPIMIIVQQQMARLNNVMPEYQRIQFKMQSPNLSHEDRIIAVKEYKKFMAENNINEVSRLILILCQGGVFASMFFAIRGMAACPVESMKEGGLYWFVDLTATDPLGAEGMDMNTVNPMMRKFMLCMPLLCFPFMINFPAALNIYWLTSNLITIGQSRLLRLKPVRDRLGIPEMIKWRPEDLPMNNVSFFDMIKNAQEIQNQSAQQQHLGPYDWRMKQEELKRRSLKK